MRHPLVGVLAGLVTTAALAQDPSSSAKQLSGLLQQGAKKETDFLAIEAAAKQLRDHDLQALVKEVRPLGAEGYADWVRCAVFAEWGRRSPVAALEWVKNPPPGKNAPNHHNRREMRLQFISVYRGWAEVDPDAALAKIKTEKLGDSWQDDACREIFRRLATRDGMAAWDRLPVESGRGGALQGIFRGLATPQDRLQAILRWHPEVDSPGDLGYRLGPEMLEYRKRHSWFVHAKSKFITDAAMALAEADLGMAVDWLKNRVSAEWVGGLLWRWGELHLEDAMAELEAGRYSKTDLIIGILSGDPKRAPQLIARIEDKATRTQTLELVIFNINRHAWADPQSPDHLHGPQAAENYDALREAITTGGLADDEVTKLQDKLRSKFSHYLRKLRKAKKAPVRAPPASPDP